jgi:hypothetical protein
MEIARHHREGDLTLKALDAVIRATVPACVLSALIADSTAE